MSTSDRVKEVKVRGVETEVLNYKPTTIKSFELHYELVTIAASILVSWFVIVDRFGHERKSSSRWL